MNLEDIPNIAMPGSATASTCGYCSPPGRRSEQATSHHSATLEAVRLSCSAYQEMIDRGWRRSGKYCYKPDLKISCCPQYTIKLDAVQFKHSRSQRQLLNRWNRFVIHGESDATMAVEDPAAIKPPKASKKAVPKLPPFTTLADSIHASESNIHAEHDTAHIFEVILEPASYTAQKFALYEKYQSDIHHDEGKSPSGFKRFLVDSPLVAEPIPYSSQPPSYLPRNYGSYHQLYKLDGQLIAMAVLDILPRCVSSVYFMYDKTWERFSMGKLSALREVSLAREIRDAGSPTMDSLYMGFYIYSCQKMRYKGEYSPSYLADPETYDWYPLQSCIPLLEKHRYACFSNPSRSSSDGGGLDEESDVESEASELAVGSNEFDSVMVLARKSNGNIVGLPIRNTKYLSFAQVREEMGCCLRGLGPKLIKEFAFAL